MGKLFLNFYVASFNIYNLELEAKIYLETGIFKVLYLTQKCGAFENFHLISVCFWYLVRNEFLASYMTKIYPKLIPWKSCSRFTGSIQMFGRLVQLTGKLLRIWINDPFQEQKYEISELSFPDCCVTRSIHSRRYQKKNETAL